MPFRRTALIRSGQCRIRANYRTMGEDWNPRKIYDRLLKLILCGCVSDADYRAVETDTCGESNNQRIGSDERSRTCRRIGKVEPAMEITRQDALGSPPPRAFDGYAVTSKCAIATSTPVMQRRRNDI
ncbi:unnamed protein product, partial [Nesidiocoris tenuis]